MVAIWKNTWTSWQKVFPVPQKNENPLSGCFDTPVSLSYSVCPNKTLTPVMGLPPGMGLFVQAVRTKSPRCSSPLPHYVVVVRVPRCAPTCAPLWPRVFMLMCLCVRERARERERWLTPNEGERSQMMQWIVFTKRYFKTNEQTLSRSIFHKPATLLCLYAFSCSCWLSSLNEALYSSVGYRLQRTMSSRSLLYSVGSVFLLLLMKGTHCGAFPTAASATAVKAFLSLVNDLGPFSLQQMNMQLYLSGTLLGGVSPSESKQCEIRSGAYKNTPRGVQNKIQQTHAASPRYGIYMMHNARDANVSIWLWESGAGGDWREKWAAAAAAAACSGGKCLRMWPEQLVRLGRVRRW